MIVTLAAVLGLGLLGFGFRKYLAKRRTRGFLSKVFNLAENFREVGALLGWYLAGLVVFASAVCLLKILVIAFSFPASFVIDAPQTPRAGVIAFGLSFGLMGAILGGLVYHFRDTSIFDIKRVKDYLTSLKI